MLQVFTHINLTWLSQPGNPRSLLAQRAIHDLSLSFRISARTIVMEERRTDTQPGRLYATSEMLVSPTSTTLPYH